MHMQYLFCLHLHDTNFWINWVQAAVFNQTEIAFALMDSGANLNYKNAQGKQSKLDHLKILFRLLINGIHRMRVANACHLRGGVAFVGQPEGFSFFYCAHRTELIKC